MTAFTRRPCLQSLLRNSLILIALSCMLILSVGCQAGEQDSSQSDRREMSSETEPSEDIEITAPSDDIEVTTTSGGTGDSTSQADTNDIQELKFSEMYETGNSSRGLRFSEHFKSLDGQMVKMRGFMAPPLKPVFNFFVLSKDPMSICPFCSSDADWPADIVAVYVEKGTKSVSNDSLLTIIGRLELGSFTDEETGFVSQARIYAEEIIHNR